MKSITIDDLAKLIRLGLCFQKLHLQWLYIH